MQRPFSPGRPIVLRDFWQGKVWAAMPSVVVQDDDELIVLYIMGPGAVGKRARALGGPRVGPKERAAAGWVLHDITWKGMGFLRLSVPRRRYSVLVFWSPDGVLQRWSINLEEPLRRTALGFDMADKLLDVVLTPDLRSWRWEDEDELEEAVSIGAISRQEAADLYAEGWAAVDALQSGKSIFNGWENWRPDPPWPVPVLPAGWDKI